MKQRLQKLTASDLLSIALVTAALLVTALVAKRLLDRAQRNPSQAVAQVPGGAWRGMLARPASEAGETAPVQLVVYSDYSCVHCESLQQTLRRLAEHYPEHVAVRYRHLPLQRPSAAYTAAVSAECARKQGHFDAFHRILFSEQARLDEGLWVDWARRAGLPDHERFHTCVVGEETRAEVEADIATAATLELRSVPTIIMNRSLYRGALSWEVLKRLVERELESLDPDAGR